MRAFAPIDIPWQDLAFWSDESALRDHLTRPRVWTWLRVKAAALLSLRRRARARCSSSPPRSPAATSRSSATTTTPQLSVGEIRMSVDPGHRGALDIYVPLVDWGARFEAIRAPVRLRVDLQTVDREVAQGLAEGKPLDVEQVRDEARDALTAYLMKLIALVLRAARSALGLLVAFAIRSRVPRLRWTSGARGRSPTVGDRRRAGRPDPAARGDREPAVLRPRPGHPARAGGRRGRAAHLRRARPGARRAARRPRAAGGRARPAAARSPTSP